MEAPDKRTYVDFAYTAQTMHMLHRFRRVPGEGATGSVAPTDGSWQGKDGSRLGSLGYVREQTGGGRVDMGRQRGEAGVLNPFAARAPEAGHRTGGGPHPQHTSDPPTSWAHLQVHAFAQNWRTLPDTYFQPPTFIVTHLGSFHPPLQTSSSWPIFM